MLEITNTSVMNLENAMRGARNPLNSWARSDSAYDADGNYILGENDIGLGMRLCRAGSDHRKFIRQIIVSADITAPLYWWNSTLIRSEPSPIPRARCTKSKRRNFRAAIFRTII